MYVCMYVCIDMYRYVSICVCIYTCGKQQSRKRRRNKIDGVSAPSTTDPTSSLLRRAPHTIPTTTIPTTTTLFVIVIAVESAVRGHAVGTVLLTAVPEALGFPLTPLHIKPCLPHALLEPARPHATHLRGLLQTLAHPGTRNKNVCGDHGETTDFVCCRHSMRHTDTQTHRALIDTCYTQYYISCIYGENVVV